MVSTDDTLDDPALFSALQIYEPASVVDVLNTVSVVVCWFCTLLDVITIECLVECVRMNDCPLTTLNHDIVGIGSPLAEQVNVALLKSCSVTWL